MARIEGTRTMTLSDEEMNLIKQFRAKRNAKIAKYVKKTLVDFQGNPTGTVEVDSTDLEKLVEAANSWQNHTCSGEEA
jgi:hypothetical protein